MSSGFWAAAVAPRPCAAAEAAVRTRANSTVTTLFIDLLLPPSSANSPPALDPSNLRTLEPSNPRTPEPSNPGPLEPSNPRTLAPWHPGHPAQNPLGLIQKLSCHVPPGGMLCSSL